MVQKKPNFLAVESQLADFERSKAVILPIPFDGTSTWMKGADKGPDALIAASSQVEFFEIESESEPYRHGIHTADAIFDPDIEKLHGQTYAAVKNYLAQDKFVVSLGGEHSVSYGPIRAHFEKYPKLSVLQLDAHTDLRESYCGSKWNHACIMARVRELGIPSVAVGIRAMDSSEFPGIDRDRVFFAHTIRESYAFIDKAVELLSDDVYITLDLDVFDPCFMPSTGTPEPGGLGWYQVLELIKRVCETKRLVGCDVVELCPNDQNRAPDFLAARLVYKIIGMALRPR